LSRAQRYRRTFAALQRKCPALIPVDWRQCVADGKCFLVKWGEQAEALGWFSADLVALTADTAAIRHPTGNITGYRKHTKPSYGPLGDRLGRSAMIRGHMSDGTTGG
jgi:hypothetical protein